MELHQVSHRKIGQPLIGNIGRKEKYYQIWVNMRYLMKVIWTGHYIRFSEWIKIIG